MPEQTELYGLIEQISGIDDYFWGLFTLSEDSLYNRFSRSQAEDIVKESISCGESEAVRLQKEYPQLEPEEIASELGVTVRIVDLKISEKSKIIYFGQYTKNSIFIPGDTIKEIGQQCRAAKLSESIIDESKIKSLLISHELFHYCEEQDKNLVVNTMKVRIKTLNLFYQNITPSSASEIAASAFAKRLSNSSLHPRILEIIGLYGLYPDISRSMVKRLTQMS